VDRPSQLYRQMIRWGLRVYNKSDVNNPQTGANLGQLAASESSRDHDFVSIGGNDHNLTLQTGSDEDTVMANASSYSASSITQHVPKLRVVGYEEDEDEDEDMDDDEDRNVNKDMDDDKDKGKGKDNDNDNDDNDEEELVGKTSPSILSTTDSVAPTDITTRVPVGAHPWMDHFNLQHLLKTRQEEPYWPQSPFVRIWSGWLPPSAIFHMVAIANFLAAAHLFQHAFDVYYLVFLNCSRVSDRFTLQLLGAVIDCARTCVTADQTRRAIGILEAALEWQLHHHHDKASSTALLHLYLGELLEGLGESGFALHYFHAVSLSASNDFILDDLPTDIQFREWTAMITKIQKLAPLYLSSVSAAASTKLLDVIMAWDEVNPMEMLLDWCVAVISGNAEFLDTGASSEAASDAKYPERKFHLLYCLLVQKWLQEGRPILFGTLIFRRKDLEGRRAVSCFDALATLAGLISENTHWHLDLSGFSQTNTEGENQRLSRRYVKSASFLLENRSVSELAYVDALLDHIGAFSAEQKVIIDPYRDEMFLNMALKMVSPPLLGNYPNVHFPLPSDPPPWKMQLPSSALPQAPPGVAETASILSQSSVSSSVKMFLDVYNRIKGRFTIFSLGNRTTQSITMSIDSHDSWNFNIVTGMPSEPISDEAQREEMSAGIGIVQPCALATSKATPIGEIVSFSWYDDS
jgi:hypothetical protein